MKIYHVVTGALPVNTYFLVNEETRCAVAIDTGEVYPRIKAIEKDLDIKIKAILLTHAHFDHAGNVKRLQDDGVKIYISKIDAPKLLNDENLAKDFGRKFNYCKADYTFSDGEILDIEGIKIKVIATPGHTDGSVTFMVDNALFTGDTLFNGTVGRTDFPTGDAETLYNSVQKLFSFDGNYKVYPGHLGFTDLDTERKTNVMAEYD